MEYKVYQVTLTDADVNLVNAEGHHAVPKHHRFLNLSMGFGKTDDEKRAMFAEAWSKGDYGAPVATVWARNLEEVFEVGNGMGEQSRLERHGRMKSVSVGDVVRDEDGKLHLVDSTGFLALDYQGAVNRGEMWTELR